jgi:hypothetical protein
VHTLRFLFFFILFLYPLSQAHAACTKEDLYPVDPYSAFQFRENVRSMVIPEAGSSAAQHPPILNQVNNLRAQLMKVKEFQDEFDRVNKRLPRRQEVHAFFQSRLDLIRTNTQLIADQLKVQRLFFQSWQIEKRIDEHMVLWERDFTALKNNPNAEAAMKVLDQLNLEWNASLTELATFVAVKDALYWGEKIEFIPELRKHMEDKFKDLKRAAREDPHFVSGLRQHFSFLTDNDYLRRQTALSDEAFLDALFEWICSKEIDVFTFNPEQMRWIEVKMYSGTLSWDRFIAEGEGRSHSDYAQLSEDSQLMELLSLDKIQLTFVGSGWIDDTVAVALRRLKVTYLH